MRTIALEEHFASPGFINGPGREFKEQVLNPVSAARKFSIRFVMSAPRE